VRTDHRFAGAITRKLRGVDKRVIAVFRNGSRVESEAMVEEEARREVARIHEEAQAGRTNKFVKLGNSAIFKSHGRRTHRFHAREQRGQHMHREGKNG
jgi:hypothetical protein